MTHPIHIAVDVYGPWIAFQLMDMNSVEPGIARDIGHKATLTLTAMDSRAGAGFTNTLTFLLAFAHVPPDTATLSFIADWLHHRLRRRAKELVLRINSAETLVEKGAIQAALADAFHGLLDTAS